MDATKWGRGTRRRRRRKKRRKRKANKTARKLLRKEESATIIQTRIDWEQAINLAGARHSHRRKSLPGNDHNQVLNQSSFNDFIPSMIDGRRPWLIHERVNEKKTGAFNCVASL